MKQWYNMLDNQTLKDATETAKNLYGINITYYKSIMLTPEQFDKLNVLNHRAQLNKSLEEIFPYNDQPRGYKDITSVKYHMTHKSYPVVLLFYQNQFIVLDGVHRIVAAYLTNSPIYAFIFITNDQ